MAAERIESVPPGRRHIIKRPRLTRILDESTARVLMLVAPAGYGKTTLAREWLENRRHAWYQGGPASADVAALAVGLAEAVAPLVPGAGERLRGRLRATSSPEQDVEPLADLLAEDLAAWPDDAWLAMDDYQFATASEASEQFVDLLRTRSPIRLLLATRDRPRWATARRLLYGEIHELSRSSLAMNQEETSAVLTSAGRAEAPGLLALADGWPAVIGLASISTAEAVPDDVPEALYDFFAQELYERLERNAQAGFCALAVAPSVTPTVAAHLLGSDARKILRLGEGAGVLTRQLPDSYAMHPLLRTFLLRQRDDEDVAEVVRELFVFYVRARDWDAAFTVLDVAENDDLLQRLFAEAVPELLRAGRLPTIRRWLERAESHSLQSPELDLASAELAYRQGNVRRAEAIAVQTLETVAIGEPIRPRLLLLAGKAALLAHRTAEAIGYSQQARDEAVGDDEAYEATWDQFIAAARLERPQANDLLRELDAMSCGVPERELRRIGARFVLGVRMGTLQGLDAVFDSVLHLLPRAAEPLSRSSFLIGRAHLLTLAARYTEALEAVAAVFAEAQNYRLDFALPHASMVKALVHLGQREFAQASPLIAYTEEAGLENRDAFVRMNSAALRARLLIYQGDPSAALAAVSETWDSLPERAMYAEYLAMRAFCLACGGVPEEAISQAKRIAGLSSGVEAAVIGACANAIATLQTTPAEGHAAGVQAVETARRTNNYDGLLFALRVSPPLLEAVISETGQADALRPVVRDAADDVLARRLKVSLPRRPSKESLTPREQEVYELLALGRTNKEIAAALFISERTAKVHTLRVMAKLGARSRTEVALHAASRMSGLSG